MNIESFPKAAETLKEIFVGLVAVAKAEQVTWLSLMKGPSEYTCMMYCSMWAHVRLIAGAKSC